MKYKATKLFVILVCFLTLSLVLVSETDIDAKQEVLAQARSTNLYQAENYTNSSGCSLTSTNSGYLGTRTRDIKVFLKIYM